MGKEPAYVTLAGKWAKQIRSGERRPGSRFHSYADLVVKEQVTEIVVRRAIELLISQGLARSVRRKGVFVTDYAGVRRISPERQHESPESTFERESTEEITIHREVSDVPAPNDVTEWFGVPQGSTMSCTVTKAAIAGRPVSVSDTYQPIGTSGISGDENLEETLRDCVAPPEHAEWLKVDYGNLVKSVSQRFTTFNGDPVMASEVYYPWDRYDGFTFRMSLKGNR